MAFKNPDSTEAKIQHHCVRVGLSNIRIIQKIRRLARDIAAELSDFDDRVLDQALATLTVFCWCRYSSDDDAVSYEFAKGSRLHFAPESVRNEQSEERQKWSAKLRAIDFHAADEFDLAIARVVETGYIDSVEFRVAANRKHDEWVATGAKNAFFGAWELFHNSFADNEEELVAALLQNVNEHARFISPMNLSSTVVLMRQLSRDNEADEMIDVYIKARDDDPDFFDLSENAFAGEVRDQKVIDAFRAKAATAQDDRSMEEILVEAAKAGGVNRKYARRLLNASSEEYLEFFRGHAGADLDQIVHAALLNWNMEAPRAGMGDVPSPVVEALKTLADESRVNAIRMRRYEIGVEGE